MNYRHRGLILTVMAAWCCGRLYADPPSSSGADKTTKAATKKPLSDQEILSQLHLSNKTDIEAAQLSEERASTDDVLDFAHHLGKEHTVADLKVRALAGRLGIKLKEALTPITDDDKKIVARHESTMARLRSSKGREFEHILLRLVTREHATHIHLLERQLKLLPKDSPVYELVTQCLPELREQYQTASHLGGLPQ